MYCGITVDSLEAGTPLDGCLCRAHLADVLFLKYTIS